MQQQYQYQTEKNERNTQQRKVLQGDEAITYYKQVIEQNNSALQQVAQVNQQLHNKLDSIMNQLPGVCCCSAPSVFKDIMQYHDRLIDENVELQAQIAQKQQEIVKLEKMQGIEYPGKVVESVDTLD